jgi:hypothetical protein
VEKVKTLFIEDRADGCVTEVWSPSDSDMAELGWQRIPEAPPHVLIGKAGLGAILDAIAPENAPHPEGNPIPDLIGHAANGDPVHAGNGSVRKPCPEHGPSVMVSGCDACTFWHLRASAPPEEDHQAERGIRGTEALGNEPTSRVPRAARPALARKAWCRVIRVQVGESSVDVWETPDGIEARASLYVGFGKDRLELVNVRFMAKDATETALAMFTAMRLEQFADSAIMMARELREKFARKEQP